jgi:hypothetical protein
VLAIDTYDQPFFPTRGVKLDVTHFDAHRVSSNVEEYARSEARFGVAGTLGAWTVLGGLEGGYTGKGSLPLADAFTLGGPRRLSGFATDQLLGSEYAFGRLEAQYRLHASDPVFGLSFIGGLMAESGRMNKRITDGSAVRLAELLRRLYRRQHRPRSALYRLRRREERQGALLPLHRLAVSQRPLPQLQHNSNDAGFSSPQLGHTLGGADRRGAKEGVDHLAARSASSSRSTQSCGSDASRGSSPRTLEAFALKMRARTPRSAR